MNLKRPREDAAEEKQCIQRPPPPATLASAATAARHPEINPWTKKPYSPNYYRVREVRERLPVYEHKEIIQAAVQQNPVTLLIGETGSGKTTQVAQFLAEVPQFANKIACTQPRRIAAVSVAARVAEEMDVTLGVQVGYHVRFDSKQSDQTKVLFLTDGMLLRECLSDPDCGKFSVVIVDEAHERTIDTDTVLGFMKLILQRRPMLRVVVMSATLDIDKIQSFFPSAPLVRVSGRRYDVSVHYMPHPVKDYVETAVACVAQIHEKEATGDILCFLTGVAEIESAVAKTKRLLNEAPVPEKDTEAPHRSETRDDRPPRDVVVLPLYGTLQLEEQKKVFQPYGDHVRKIIFSTNIAETSVTIDGVVYVVDCGYQKQTLYASEGRIDYLLPAVISKAAAEQRKGRAGRTKPGKCYRLFTMENYEKFPDQTYPEILRNNFVDTLLLLLQLGVTNPCDFPFIDAPPDNNMEEAFYQLMYFGAVNEELQLTEFGKQLALVPLDVCLARMLLKSASHGCAADAAVVAAMLQVGQVFLRPAQKAQQADQMHAALLDTTGGDHAGLFHVFHAFYKHQNAGEQFCFEHFLRYQALRQALKVYQQLRALLATMKVPVRSTYGDGEVDTVALRRAILEGYFMQVAYWSSEKSTYLTVRDGMPIRPHPQSSLGKTGAPRPAWILYDRIEVQGDGGAFVRVACGVDVQWLLEVSTFYTNPTEINNGEILVALARAKDLQTDKGT